MPPGDSKRYDAFISYNARDVQAVQELGGRLQGEGLHLYLEEWELVPGREFQPALVEGLNESKTCVVFLGPNGLGPWQKQEIQVAIDKRTRDSAFSVIPVLLPGAERPRRGDVAHLEFLINASWVEFLKTLDDKRAFRKLVWGITGKKPNERVVSQYEQTCPYRGLEAFRLEDAPLFFGRQALTGWLISALRREIRAAAGVRFLGVLGPSGSGKSSVVMAGLVPELAGGAIEGSERWPVAIMRPGDEPLKNLVAAVVPVFQPAGSLPDIEKAQKLLEACRNDREGLSLDLFARMVLNGQPEDMRLILVVDQFEELFTYRPQDDQARERFEAARSAFFANLLNAAAAPGGRVAVVMTMRSDFLGSCALFPQLAAVVSAHQELVGPMNREELREAIEQPAFLAGCEVEPALTERLLADVDRQSGALPLLQFALAEIWKKRDVRRLNVRAYDELGGVAGALEHRANEFYTHLSPEDQNLCRGVFLRLVQPGEGTEDTKRRVFYRELLPAEPTRAAAVRKLIATLADRDTRLLTTEGDAETGGIVEVAHEALVRGWTQFRGWLLNEREGLRIHRRLTEAAQEWAASGPEHKEDYLFSGARLAVCREWASAHGGELNSVEVAFLAVSAEAEKSELEERARQAEALVAEQTKRVAEQVVAAKQLRRRTRQTIVSLAVGLVLVAGLALWGITKAEDARVEAHVANANLTQKSWEEGDIETALKSLKEQQRDTVLPWEYDLRGFEWYHWWRLCHRDELPKLVGHTNQVCAVAFDDKETLISAAGEWNRPVEVKMWNLSDGKVRSVTFNDDIFTKPVMPNAIAISQNGRYLAIYCRINNENSMSIWDVQEPGSNAKKSSKSLSGVPGCLAFSADGSLLAGKTGVWKWRAQVECDAYKNRAKATALAFNGKGLLALAQGCKVGLLQAGKYEDEPALLLEAPHTISYLVFSSDDQVRVHEVDLPTAGVAHRPAA